MYECNPYANIVIRMIDMNSSFFMVEIIIKVIGNKEQRWLVFDGFCSNCKSVSYEDPGCTLSKVILK